MKKENTASRLKEIMEDRNLRQIDILNMTAPYCSQFNVKMNKSDISQYLSGKAEPNQDKLYVLSRALNVNPSWLMGYDVERTADNKSTSKKGVKIPVLGRVAAGIPIEAIEEVIDEEEITEDMARCGKYFGLIIHGDSMSPSICDGDTVIVRQQEDAESGEIVIATINGDDATCKRLRKHRDGIELISNNPSYPPFDYSKKEVATKPVKIIGKVVELRRKF